MRFDNDGIHIHQSDLKNHCLEKLRLETVATGPRLENDAATVGTALHAVIEYELAGNMFETRYDCQAYAAHTYVRLLEEYQQDGKPYALSSFNSHDRAIELLTGLAAAWYECSERIILLGSSEAPHIEWNFDLPFCEVEVKKHGKKQEIVPVFLAGTADIIHNNMVWDWKTSGSEYRRWEYQRWGRQPDVYTWAAAKSGLIHPNSDGLYRFDFKVFVRNNDPSNGCQTVTVERSQKSWDWLQEIVSRLVNFSYNMGLDREWPVDDQHVLCSPKWCTFFDMCKGSHVSGETWV